MKKNYHYTLSATLANPRINIKTYVHYFPTLKANYNKHIVSFNPKEIDSIRISDTNNSTIIFDFWSEKKLPIGRELQSLRRISEDLASYDNAVVIGKSHVLISVWIIYLCVASDYGLLFNLLTSAFFVLRRPINWNLKEGYFMDRFNDSEYAVLIGDLLHDTQYIEISNMGKMAGLRKHAEVMVRKILDIGNSKSLMLGQVKKKSNNPAVNSGMNNLGDELSDRLIEIIVKINPLGCDGTHTQHTDEFSNEEIESVEDAILDLYALIFIKYFLDIQVSIYSPPQVLRMFSILPPIIRYKTWKYLYEKDKNNILVVDKLCLSIIKLFNKEIAYKWLDDNSETIKAIPYPTKYEIEKYYIINSIEISPGKYQAMVSLNFDKYNNMYDLLYNKISDPRTSINESGKMYRSFEEAIEHYNNYKRDMIRDNSKEEVTFYSLMDFVYLGRKTKSEMLG